MQPFLDKFKNAFRGIKIACKDQSILMQLVLMVLVLVFYSFFSLSEAEWFLIIICCVLVVLFEFMNTVVERIMDFVNPEYNEEVKRIKDLSAAMVLLACIFASAIGLYILWGKL